jgi:hypothetical protein
VADMGLSVEDSSQKDVASLALANNMSAYFPTISLKIFWPTLISVRRLGSILKLHTEKTCIEQIKHSFLAMVNIHNIWWY